MATIADDLGIDEPRFLVERMIDGAVAEVLVGLRRDARFGGVLVLASGGVLVELVGDTRTLLLPARREDIARALDELKVSRLINGFRGQTRRRP